MIALKQLTRRWLAGAATVLSLAACYGTLAIIAILGVLGFTIALDERLWAGAIVAFATLAFAGLGLGVRRHGRPWPILIGGAGLATVAYVMYGQYNQLLEVAGFAMLCGATFWDWRLGRVPSPDPQG